MKEIYFQAFERKKRQSFVIKLVAGIGVFICFATGIVFLICRFCPTKKSLISNKNSQVVVIHEPTTKPYLSEMGEVSEIGITQQYVLQGKDKIDCTSDTDIYSQFHSRNHMLPLEQTNVPIITSNRSVPAAFQGEKFDTITTSEKTAPTVLKQESPNFRTYPQSLDLEEIPPTYANVMFSSNDHIEFK